ncbi:hypothetical protein [Sphingobacterium multivorum]|uniref:hypothetical protein n=1 Tax=Sphingobacterium multivorum TaxID=28454 RepID=UPI003694051E
MARKKNVLGLKVVLMGAIAADGGMGTTLTEILGDTVKGSASLVLNEGTTETLEVEEYDEAFDEVDTAPAKWAFQLESYNVSAKALSDLGGGEYTAGTGGAGDSIEIDVPEAIELSVSIETRNGAKFEIPRMKVRIKPQFDFMKAQYGKVIITGTPLKPTKEGVATITKIDAAA